MDQLKNDEGTDDNQGAAPEPGKTGQTSSSVPLDFLWKVHDYSIESIRFADTKAALMIAISSGLIGTLFATKAHHYCMPSRFAPIHPTWKETWLGIGSLCAFVLLGLSVVLAVLAISPRLWEEPQEDKSLQRRIIDQLTKVYPPGFIFWKSILAHGDQTKFWDNLSEQTQRDLTRFLAEHTFILAGICDTKFRFINRSIGLGFAGALFACLFILGSS